jgi:hypothetical protein
MTSIHCLWVLMFLWAIYTVVRNASALKTGDVINVKVSNNTKYQVRELSFRFHEGNIQDEFEIPERNAFYTVTARPPIYTFAVRLEGFIPKRTRVYQSEVRLASSLSRFNGTNTEEVPEGPARRLMGFKTELGLCGMLPLVGDVCKSGWAALDSKAYCAGNIDLFDVCGSDGAQGEIERLLALEKYRAEQTAFDQNVTRALGEQDKLNSAVNVTLNRIRDQLAFNIERQDSLNESIFVIQRAYDDQAIKLNSEFRNLYSRLETGLTTAYSAGEQNLAAFRNVTTANFQRTLEAINSVINASAANDKTHSKKNRDLLRMINRIASTLHRYIEETDTERALSAMVWERIAQAQREGLHPFLLAGAEGRAPTRIVPADVRQVLVDRFIINYATSIGQNQRLAHSYDLSMFCDMDEVSRPSILNVGWSDIIEMIGPKGCITLAETSTPPKSPVETCGCWFIGTLQTCTATSEFISGGTAASSSFNGFKLHAGMCQQSPVSTTVKIDSSTVFNQLLENVCRTPLFASTSTFQFVTQRLTTSQQVKQLLKQCTISTDLFYDNNDAVDAGLPWVVFTTLTYSWQIMIAGANEYYDYVEGGIPNLLDTEYIPFQRMPDGRHYRSNRISFLAVSQETLPVYSIRLESIEHLVSSVGVDMTTGLPVEPPETIANIPVTNTNSEMLPLAGAYIIGELSANDMEVTGLYDVPFEMINMSPEPPAREGKITYPLCRIPAGYDPATTDINPNMCSMGEWMTDNKYYFKHQAGAVSADRYHREFDNQACTGSAVYPGVSSLCNMLDQWFIHPTTNMRQGKLVLYPNEWAYPTVQVRAIQGEIVERVESGCPEFTFATYDAGAQLQLRNTLPNPIECIVERKSDSPHCVDVGDITLKLLPKQVYHRNVPACGNYTVRVYRISETAQRIAIPCGNAINTTVIPNSPVNVEPSTLGAGNITTITDVTFSLLEGIQRDSIIALITIASFERGNTNFTIGELKSRNNTFLLELLEKIRKDGQTVDFTAITLASQLANVTARQNEIRAKQIENLIYIDASLKNVSDATAAVHAETVNIINGIAGLVNASLELSAKNLERIAFLQRQHDAAACPFFWCKFVDILIMIAVFGAIALVIYCIISAILKRASTPSPPIVYSQVPTQSKNVSGFHRYDH